MNMTMTIAITSISPAIIRMSTMPRNSAPSRTMIAPTAANEARR